MTHEVGGKRPEFRITLDEAQQQNLRDDYAGVSEKVDAKLSERPLAELLRDGAIDLRESVTLSPAQLTQADAHALKGLVDGQGGVQISKPAAHSVRFVLEQRESRLTRGEVLTYAYTPAGTTEVHEITQGLVQAPFENLLTAMGGPEAWAAHLHGLHGLDTKVIETETVPGDDGQPVERVKYQLERMATRSESMLDKLDQWLGDALPGGDNDMTKLEAVERGVGPDGRAFAVVKWEVIHSDNGSTLMDIGEVRFADRGDGTTLVTYDSVHRINAMPDQSWGQAVSESAPGLMLVRSGLRTFFSDCVRQLQRLASEL